MWVKGSTKCGQAGESIPAHLHKAILSLQWTKQLQSEPSERLWATRGTVRAFGLSLDSRGAAQAGPRPTCRQPPAPWECCPARGNSWAALSLPLPASFPGSAWTFTEFTASQTIEAFVQRPQDQGAHELWWVSQPLLSSPPRTLYCGFVPPSCYCPLYAFSSPFLLSAVPGLFNGQDFPKACAFTVLPSSYSNMQTCPWSQMQAWYS